MPFRSIRCILCKENDTWFSVMYTEQGKKDLVNHMNTEHGESMTVDIFDD